MLAGHWVTVVARYKVSAIVNFNALQCSYLYIPVSHGHQQLHQITHGYKETSNSEVA